MALSCRGTHQRTFQATPPTARSLFAEEIGLDYVFSMAKWRGFGGTSQFWDQSLESFSLMSALAPITERLSLIATVNPLLFHPALMAKMAASIDDVSGGRLGLNIITGSSLTEYGQMGVVPLGYDQNRYAYASEWIHVLKRLWTEERVTHDGAYFHLDDCVSMPKPVQRPYPFLVCAGTSEEGLRFTAREANYSFLGGNNVEDTKATSRRAKQIGAEERNAIKTATTVVLVIGDTRDDAVAKWEYMIEGADLEAIENVGATFSGETRKSHQERGGDFLADPRRISFAGRPLIGTADDIAAEMIGLALDGELDSILLIFPDYLEGLQRFGDEVMPALSAALDVGVQAAASDLSQRGLPREI